MERLTERMSLDAFLNLVDRLPSERRSLFDRIGRSRRNRNRALRLFVAITVYTDKTGDMPPDDLTSLIDHEREFLTCDDLSYELPKGGTAPWVHHRVHPDPNPSDILFEAPVPEAGRRLVAFALGIVRWIEDDSARRGEATGRTSY